MKNSKQADIHLIWLTSKRARTRYAAFLVAMAGMAWNIANYSPDDAFMGFFRIATFVAIGIGCLVLGIREHKHEWDMVKYRFENAMICKDNTCEGCKRNSNAK